MNPFFYTLLILSIGVGHGCRLVDNCEPSPSPPPPEPSPCPSSPEPNPCPPPPEPSPCSPPPEPSPCPSPPEPSPCPPPPEPSPCPPPPQPSPCPPSCQCQSSIETDVIRSTSTIDVSFYQTAFSISSISETECQLYIQYLNQLPSTQISAFNEIMNWYSSKCFTLADSITNFIAFRNEMMSIYQLFHEQSLYAADANWASQTTIYEQAKNQCTNALGYCVPGCSLYNLIHFACADVTYMPLVVGTCYYLTDLQYQFYTASSGSSFYQETSSSHQESASSYQAASSSSSSTVLMN